MKTAEEKAKDLFIDPREQAIFTRGYKYFESYMEQEIEMRVEEKLNEYKVLLRTTILNLIKNRNDTYKFTVMQVIDTVLPEIKEEDKKP